MTAPGGTDSPMRAGAAIALYLMGRSAPTVPGRRGIPRSRLTWAEPRVERVAKGVTEHVNGHEQPDQQEARDDGDPPGAGEHQVVAGAHQRAERRLGHRHAEAE